MPKTICLSQLLCDFCRFPVCDLLIIKLQWALQNKRHTPPAAEKIFPVPNRKNGQINYKFVLDVQIGGGDYLLFSSWVREWIFFGATQCTLII